MINNSAPPPTEEPPKLRAGKITRIAPQKRNRARISIHIDGSFAFGVMQDIVLEYSLSVGDELSVERQEAMLHQSAFVRAKFVALEYISYKARTEHEVRTKLTDKGFTKETAERAIRRLIVLDYINDVRFAHAFVIDRVTVRRYGRRRILRDMQRRGVGEELMQEAIEGLKDEVVKQAALEAAIKQKKKLAKEPSFYKRRQKLQNFLARRGFSGDIVRAVSEETLVKEEEETSREPRERARAEAMSIDALFDLAQKRQARLQRTEPSPYNRRRKLQAFLARKGASFDIIKDILTRLGEVGGAPPQKKSSESARKVLDDDAALTLARKRWRLLENREPNLRKRRKKVQDTLMRKGVPFSTISAMLDTITSEAEAGGG